MRSHNRAVEAANIPNGLVTAKYLAREWPVVKSAAADSGKPLHGGGDWEGILKLMLPKQGNFTAPAKSATA